LVAKLARLGTSLPVEPVTEVAPLIETFDFATFGRAPARFDLGELAQLNARIVHLLPFEAVAERLPAGMGPEEWSAIRPNLKTVAEAADWWDILHGHVETKAAEDRDLVEAAVAVAAEIDWREAPWPQLVEQLKERTGRGDRPVARGDLSQARHSGGSRKPQDMKSRYVSTRSGLPPG
jgi:glutamyl-tRNA synthetase